MKKGDIVYCISKRENLKLHTPYVITGVNGTFISVDNKSKYMMFYKQSIFRIMSKTEYRVMKITKLIEKLNEK